MHRSARVLSRCRLPKTDTAAAGVLLDELDAGAPQYRLDSSESARAGFYAERKEKYGPEAWAVLEQQVGSLS